jgi:cation:H+ antiporter
LIYLQLVGGLVILLLGGDFLVRGAVSLARRLAISPLVIGLTVVAFGTSAPELIVSVEAALNGVAGIAIGNVVGSNVANILLVLGLPAIILPIVCDTPSLIRDVAVMIGASVLFTAFCWSGTLASWQGVVLVALLAAYLVNAYRNARRGDGPTGGEDDFDGIVMFPQTVAVFAAFIVVGLAGLMFGSHLLVDGAVTVARVWGVSETVIGLTLVAVGTSLPELATTLVAAIRRHGSIAVGNVVGSNLFNILGVMGVTAIVAPIPIPDEILAKDIWIMLGAAALMVPFALRQAPISRGAGIVFTIAYGAFVWSQFTSFANPAARAAGLAD